MIDLFNGKYIVKIVDVERVEEVICDVQSLDLSMDMHGKRTGTISFLFGETVKAKQSPHKTLGLATLVDPLVAQMEWYKERSPLYAGLSDESLMGTIIAGDPADQRGRLLAMYELMRRDIPIPTSTQEP